MLGAVEADWRRIPGVVIGRLGGIFWMILGRVLGGAAENGGPITLPEILETIRVRTCCFQRFSSDESLIRKWWVRNRGMSTSISKKVQKAYKQKERENHVRFVCNLEISVWRETVVCIASSKLPTLGAQMSPNVD